LMTKIIRALSCLAVASVAGGCWPGLYGNNAAQYLQRSDTITLSAGNAKDINAATHVIDPWPRYVRNRRIPANGERMVGAVQRYQRPAARSQAQIGQAAGAGGAGGAPPAAPPSGAAGPSAMQPY
jgi:hypothetical protein